MIRSPSSVFCISAYGTDASGGGSQKMIRPLAARGIPGRRGVRKQLLCHGRQRFMRGTPDCRSLIHPSACRCPRSGGSRGTKGIHQERAHQRPSRQIAGEYRGRLRHFARTTAVYLASGTVMARPPTGLPNVTSCPRAPERRYHRPTRPTPNRGPRGTSHARGPHVPRPFRRSLWRQRGLPGPA